MNNSRINPDSPAGAAFIHYVNSGELGPLGDSERDEFASVAHMWLNTPIVADDAEVAPLLAEWLTALETL